MRVARASPSINRTNFAGIWSGCAWQRWTPARSCSWFLPSRGDRTPVPYAAADQGAASPDGAQRSANTVGRKGGVVSGGARICGYGESQRRERRVSTGRSPGRGDRTVARTHRWSATARRGAERSRLSPPQPRCPSAISRTIASSRRKRRQILGRAPGDEPRAVAIAPEPDRQGPQEPARQPVEEGEREPGEVGAVGHHVEPGGARAQDRPHPRRTVSPRPSRSASSDGRPSPGDAVAGQSKSIQGKRERSRRVTFAPRSGWPLEATTPAVMSRKRSRRRNSGRGSSLSMPPQWRSAAPSARRRRPFGAGGGVEPELDVREGVVEARGGGCEDGLRPGRGGGHAHHAGAPGTHGVDGLVGGVELAQGRGARARRRRPRARSGARRAAGARTASPRSGARGGRCRGSASAG